MQRIVKDFRRPPTGRIRDQNGDLPRLSDSVAHALRCWASPRRTLLKVENLGKPSLWAIITDLWYYNLSHDHRRSSASDSTTPGAPSAPTDGAGPQPARHREPTPTRRPLKRDGPGTGGHGTGSGADAPGGPDSANRFPPQLG